VGFFSGPSKDELLKTAMGIASYAMQLRMLGQIDPAARRDTLIEVAAVGGPTSIDALTTMAARVVEDNDLGWYKKNQFIGMVYGSLISVGLPAADARSIKQQIELLCSLSKPKARREPAISARGTDGNEEPASDEAIDAIMGRMMSRSENWTTIGEAIANDCLENGLREGGVVRYSEIAEYIASRHKYNTSVVQLGFTNRMHQFVQSGEIITAKAENGDLIFVHEKYADDILKDA